MGRYWRINLRQLQRLRYLMDLMLLTSVSMGLVLSLPTLAHEVQVNQDVAATFHLEPKHQPKARQPAKVWFALTRPNRQVIPLDACVCQLQVYRVTGQNQTTPILQPTLKALNVERYRGIPSAEVIFPEPGMYRLLLTGKPTSGNLFRPFRFSYQVVVTR